MVSRGLADPRLPPSSASSSAAALAIFASTSASGNGGLGGEGLGGGNEGLAEGRETLDGNISPSTAPRPTKPSSPSRATRAGVKAALMASLLHRAAISVTDRSDARGNTPMVLPNKGVGNPTHSPSSTADTRGSGVDSTGGTNGKGASGSDTAVSAASARHVVARSCAELYALLLSAREEVYGVGGDDRLGYSDSAPLHPSARFDRAGHTAVSSADIIMPLRQNGTPHGGWKRQQQQRQRWLRAAYAAAAVHLAPTLEAFLWCCCDEQFPTMEKSWQKSPPRMENAVDGEGAGGDLVGLREVCRAASDLLELLDEYPIDDGTRGTERRNGDESVLPSVSRMLREARGLCRGRAEDRASASRRLADLLLRMPGGREVLCDLLIPCRASLPVHDALQLGESCVLRYDAFFVLKYLGI